MNDGGRFMLSVGPPRVSWRCQLMFEVKGKPHYAGYTPLDIE